MKRAVLKRVALECAWPIGSVRPNVSLPSPRSALLLGVAALSLAAGASAVKAADLTWTGGSGDLLWDSGGNWQTGNAPTADDAVTIASPSSRADPIEINGIDSTGSLAIGGTVTSWLRVTQANTLTVSGELSISSGGAVAVTQVDNAVPGGIGLSVGTIDVTQGGQLNVANSTVYATSDVTLSGDLTTKMQGNGILRTDGAFVQTGGKQGIDLVIAPTYEMSGGETSTGEIDFSKDFNLSGTGYVGTSASVLVGGAGSTMEQSSGTMNGTVSGIDSYTHSGGSLGGSVTTGIYDLTNASATSAGATINAANQFTLEPGSGTARVEAYLTGTGKLVKAGDATVVIANGQNDFSGGVDVRAGTLDVLDNALPGNSAIKVGDGATLQMTANNDVLLTGTMLGDTGSLVKDGLGTLTLGGDVTLGGLSVDAGELDVGTGTSTNTASFESANIAQDATLYVAQGATLVIRVPNSITNNGHFINDGTVDDDLNNVGPFENNGAYDANVASNTGTINNNTPGVWTGNVVTNAGTISNNTGAEWDGDIEANKGLVANAAGATWKGDVVTNFGGISNHGTWIGDAGGNGADNGPGSIYNDGAGATWTGDVINNNSQIVNDNGATWTGNVNGNNNVVFNMAGSFWKGNVVASGGGSNTLAQIDNRGTWTGAVDANAGWIFNTSGSWTGNILANTNGIINNDNDPNLNPTGGNHAAWNGDISSNNGSIINDNGGIWTGNVVANAGTISNKAGATWKGDVVANSGSISNQGAWIGNAGGNGADNGPVSIYNDGAGATWAGDVINNNSQIVNDNGATWTGNVNGNNNVVFNMAGSFWKGNVVASGGGSNGLAQIDNRGTWTGAVEANAGTIFDTSGSWTGNVLANTGTIVNNDNDRNLNPTGGNHAAWNGDISSNNGSIINDNGGIWTGNVVTNAGTIGNKAGAEWDGDIKANGALGTITNQGVWTGNVLSNAGTINNLGTWTGSFTSIDGGFTNNGLLHLTGDLSVSGTLTNNGMLDGVSSVTVNAGGTLTGTGTVDPPFAVTFKSGSTFTPGTAGVPGTSITIAGNLALDPGSTTRIYFNPTASTFATVTGSASLGGTVVTSFASGSGYVSKQRTILTAAGGLGGTTFSGLTNIDLPAAASDSLSYDANNVYLNLMLKYSGLNRNQQSVGNALTNYFNTNGGIPAAFFGLAPGGLSQIDGEAATGAEQSAFQLTGSFLSLLLDPYAENRGGGFGPAPAGNASRGSLSVTKGASPSLVFTPSWNVWGAAYGGVGRLSGDSGVGSHGTTVSGAAFATGADYHVAPDTMFGFALAGGGTGWSLSNGLGGGQGAVFQAGLYGVHQFGQAAYLSGAFAFGDYDLKTQRTISLTGGGMLAGDDNAQSYGGRLEAGYHLFTDPVVLTPYGAVQAVNFEAPRYNEYASTGGSTFALAYSGQSATQTQVEIGSWIDKAMVLPGGMRADLFGRLAYAHDWQTNPSIGASFLALPGSNFTVEGAQLPENLALVTAGATLKLADNWKLTGKFDGKFARDAEFYTGTARLRYTW